MKFQVFNFHKVCVMQTENPACIPFSYIDDMRKSGYTFKIDGRTVSKKVIFNYFDAKDAGKPVTTSASSRAVRCVDTGKIYDTQSQAARDLGIDPAQVSDSIKTGRPRSGYTFEKVVSAV